MLDGEPPQWDVVGHALFVAGPAVSDQIDFRIVCYKHGGCVVTIDGVAYPVPVTMTAPQYLDMLLSRSFPDPAIHLAAD